MNAFRWSELKFHDLRTFLDELQNKSLLRKVSRPINRVHEIAAGIRYVSDNHGPALLFENILDSEIPVVGGLFATKELALEALSVDSYSEGVQRFGYGVENPIKPLEVNNAVCQEVVNEGDAINLYDFPHPIYSEGDSGPYISSGLIFSRDPDTLIQNIGIYRMEVKGRNLLCLDAPNYQHVHVSRLKTQAKNEPFQVAVAIGTDPVLYYASQAKVGYGVDELGIAGGIRNEPVEVTKAKSVDLLVPATAEIVIEGYFLPDEYLPEGPFGEFTGYQTKTKPAPVIEVTAITHRRNPLYQAVITGKPTTENHILKTFGYDWSLFHFLHNQFPEVTAATVPTAGGVQYLAFVALKQDHIGQARKVLLATLSSPIRTKIAIVVDSDVDIYNLEEVMWAISTHSQSDTDVIIIPGVAGSRIDPSSPEIGVISLLGIDGTRSLKKVFPPPSTIPGSNSFSFD